MKSGETHNIFPDYEVGAYRVSNTFNWYTGKGQMSGDILIKNGSKNKNPKIEIFSMISKKEILGLIAINKQSTIIIKTIYLSTFSKILSIIFKLYKPL